MRFLVIPRDGSAYISGESSEKYGAKSMEIPDGLEYNAGGSQCVSVCRWIGI
jgi:hypothetical protein